MIILSFLFLLTATLYSSVGFGGGSTYLALLLIWDVPYLIFPVIALFCNIIVVSGNCINYIKAGNINLKILTPYLISSVPLAFIGGSISIDKNFFEILLFIILALAGIMLLFKFKSFDKKIEAYNKIPKIVAILIGGTIGFISGVVGIGGGIFLSPILLLVRVDSTKNIATAASLFILINSISGLTGQFTKTSVINEVYKKIPIILSLLIGASIGFVSGVVGIGGGIFLSPILLLVRVDSAKNIATAASLFILINSMSGLAGQFTKSSVINEIYSYWPLFLLVLLGGQLGNFLNIKIFPARILVLVTSALVLFVAVRMGLRLFV